MLYACFFALLDYLYTSEGAQVSHRGTIRYTRTYIQTLVSEYLAVRTKNYTETIKKTPLARTHTFLRIKTLQQVQ